MRTFKVKACGHGAMTAHPAMKEFRVGGYRAPGPGVMVVQDGSGWVMRSDGSREDIDAKSVVIWDTGDWVEYGGSGALRTCDYWAAIEPLEEWQSRMAEIAGPGGSEDPEPGAPPGP